MIGNQALPVDVIEKPAPVANHDSSNESLLGKRINLNVCQAHSGTKRMRQTSMPNKEDLIKTEMKIQDYINTWIKVKRVPKG